MNPTPFWSWLEPGSLLVIAALLGLIIGSFLNVVIHRLPRMLEAAWRSDCEAMFEHAPAAPTARYDLWWPRSQCPGCATPIAARDNLPVLSYLLLGGRCRHCRTRISPRYPAVELASALTTALACWYFAGTAAAIESGGLVRAGAAALLSWYLLALAVIDLDTQLLPDTLTQPLLWLGLLGAFHGIFAPSLESAVLGAVFGYGSLWLVYWLFKRVTGKEGMGFGDFKLLAALGAWFGWQSLPALILISSAVGATVGIGLMLAGRVGRGQAIPFGPYLAAAGIIALYGGDAVSALFAPARVL